jgi:hypothetical protein
MAKEGKEGETKPTPELAHYVMVPFMIPVPTLHGVSAEHPVYVPVYVQQPIGGGGNVDAIKEQIRKAIDGFLHGNMPPAVQPV